MVRRYVMDGGVCLRREAAMQAASAIATGQDWEGALDQVLGEVIDGLDGAAPDLAVLFASPDYVPHYSELVQTVHDRIVPRVLIGCSGQGVIGGAQEIEQEPAISLLAFSLPGVELGFHHVTQSEVYDDAAGHAWLQSLDLDQSGVNAWLLLADPFSLDAERLLSLLGEAYPGAPLAGGLASGHPRRPGTQLFLDRAVLNEGAIALSVGGAYTVQTVVSQGAEPIGQTWTITGARENVVESLGMRPALEILAETFQGLDPETQQRARSNLLVGLAMDEYKDDFRRGDFLIRNLMGIDQASGELVIGAVPRVGQTLQFQLRDPHAADSELTELLGRKRDELGMQRPAGGILFACNGRGIGLFGEPNHDAAAVNQGLGPIPLAGFFCNGEIGPVGGKPFLHGFTASLALFVPKDVPLEP
jgi:small ligand-binding sensory domain FIST